MGRLILATLLGFLALHGPDGSRVFVSPKSIASLREPVGKGRFPPGTRCVITESHGGSIAVRESCDEVLRLLGRPPAPSGAP